MSKEPNSISELRRNYSKGSLHREDLHPDPIEQFKIWFEQARSAGILEPNAMILATVDQNGQPFTRTVLLKDLDARGFVFYTNFNSRKALQLAENPRCSLCFLWPDLERQVSINGIATKVSTSEALRYFVSRPLGSRLGAWTSPQSQVIQTRSVLEAKLAELKAKFHDGEVPLPSFWGGYRVAPASVEFWQGGRDRLHDRFIYGRSEVGDPAPEEWSIRRLAP